MSDTEAPPRRRSEGSGRQGVGGLAREADANGEQLLDVHDVAALLRVKPQTVYQWAYQRRLAAVKLFGPRGALRFRKTTIDALISGSERPALRPKSR